MTHVYFIESGLVSVLANISSTKAIETWLVGSEGLTGIPLILGNNRAVHRRIVHVNGAALRVPLACIRAAMLESPTLQNVILRYINTVLVATSQIAACNAGHSVSERLVRWLLSAHDRCEDGNLPITHDALSRMVGVRRSSITERLHDLEDKGLIATSRSLIRIEDRQRLERHACRCYSIVRSAYDLMPRESRAVPEPRMRRAPVDTPSPNSRDDRMRI